MENIRSRLLVDKDLGKTINARIIEYETIV